MPFAREAYEMLRIPLWGLDHADVSEVDPEAQRLVMQEDPRLRIAWDRADRRFKVLIKMEPDEAAVRLNGRVIRGWYCVSWIQDEKGGFLPLNIGEIRAWLRRNDQGVNDQERAGQRFDADQAEVAEKRAFEDEQTFDLAAAKFTDRLVTSRRSSAVMDGSRAT
jgi:hypothetical protein